MKSSQLSQKTITLIDTFGFFFRNYFALPPLKSREGFPTGLLTGFINFINIIEKEHATDYIVFCIESKAPSRRAALYPAYKANRPEAPEDFKKQLPVALSWLEKMGFRPLMVEGYEADDVIASLAHWAREEGMKVRIVSHDKDLYQLINDNNIVIWDPIKKSEVDSEGCYAKFGVKPEHFVDFQALVGDSSDNVPGVRGIGPKSAAALIALYPTLEEIY
ncbi:MAG: DNA polymerase I, partial [Campylobacterales bacterium]